ncbi:hypothetical protein PCANC_09217 [Puccinia coronata f. sp. avenae]|uniref:C2H2-type domain-containing protein n=1 Tax=Puccinia coronata f. sp. avenae TaxID=200324 RepID=A0A2N5SZF6_9BASI|nr:hypothetical protein PCANC_09217 [Puccinia coronata f. sp. avenae]
MTDHTGFDRTGSGSAAIYVCNACGSRSMKEKQIPVHRKLARHQNNVKNARLPVPEQENNDELPPIHNRVLNVGVSEVNDIEMDSGLNSTPEDYLHNVSEMENDIEEERQTNAAELREALDRIGEMTREDFFDVSGTGITGTDGNIDWTELIYDGMQEEMQEDAHDEANCDKSHEGVSEGENVWFPFKNKMELVGSLLIGYSRHIISRAVYEHIQVTLRSLCDLSLPSWSTVCRAQARIRKFLDIDIQISSSIWGTPCVSLGVKNIIQKELCNPHVAPHLEFYPEDPYGNNCYRLSQSQKWREDFSPSALSRASNN